MTALTRREKGDVRDRSVGKRLGQWEWGEDSDRRGDRLARLLTSEPEAQNRIYLMHSCFVSLLRAPL